MYSRYDSKGDIFPPFANHTARLPISAIQIRIKQYKFNKHLFWIPLVSISTLDYRQRGPSGGGISQISKAFQNL